MARAIRESPAHGRYMRTPFGVKQPKWLHGCLGPRVNIPGRLQVRQPGIGNQAR
jgi:hypothetical protein